MVAPPVQYEYDPTTGAVDQTGYWALTEENSSSCAITPPATPKTGINPLLLLLAPLGVIGIVAVSGEKKGGKR
jgi:hypothetical protein